jgi:hypothetical protein
MQSFAVVDFHFPVADRVDKVLAVWRLVLGSPVLEEADHSPEAAAIGVEQGHGHRNKSRGIYELSEVAAMRNSEPYAEARDRVLPKLLKMMRSGRVEWFAVTRSGSDVLVEVDRAGKCRVSEWAAMLDGKRPVRS